jgi:glycosyltransferase involved in cell wall biosynthesis
MISVLILTKNELKDLPGCLRSVSWSDDVHVFDSYSTDGTVEFARQVGARVTQRQFDNWAQHQNWGLCNIRFKYDWVFYLDADERVTDGLQRALYAAVRSPQQNIAFRVQRRDFFLGKWLKHVQATSHYLRLFRPEKMSYQRLVNPVSVPAGPVSTIDGYLDHFPFSKGIEHWLTRHNAYSTLEAMQIKANRGTQETFSLRKAFFAADLAERRFHQKEAFYRLPVRPLVKFLALYLVKRGFLDGKAGFTFAVLQAMYEYMIVLKTKEMIANNCQNELSPLTVNEHPVSDQLGN